MVSWSFEALADGTCDAILDSVPNIQLYWLNNCQIMHKPASIALMPTNLIAFMRGTNLLEREFGLNVSRAILAMRYSKKYDEILQDELLQGDECDYSGDGSSSEVRVGNCGSLLYVLAHACVCGCARACMCVCVCARVCV